MRLSKAGYGDPEKILSMPTNIVITALYYEKFLKEYEEVFLEMNKR